MMTVARNIACIDRRIRAGETVPKSEGVSGLQLSGRTLGLIGGGNIAQQVGRMFYGAFQGSIIVYDPYLSPSARDSWINMIPQDKITIVDKDNLDGLLSVSDVVSIHVPLLESTRDLLAARELALMKPTAILINSARGGIINEEDLADALDQGLILGAGIDAYEIEPPTLQSAARLIKHPRVVST
jgi:D-3-phosphoglycerate dehydrogenase